MSEKGFKNYPLIGLVGQKFTGKDTVGSYFEKEYGYYPMSFAEPLKEVLQSVFLLTDKQVYGNEKEIIDERWKVTPRELHQIVGSGLFRETLPQYIPHLEDEIWIRNFALRYENKKKEHSRIVITDVRHYNEAKFIKDNKGILVRIYRNEKDLYESEDEHSSEQQCLGIKADINIHNSHNETTIYTYMINQINEFMKLNE